MYTLTKTEAQFLLDILRELKDPEAAVFTEELDQAIEILEALIEKDNSVRGR